MPSGWNIQTSDLPGYTPPPAWWRGPNMEVFELPGTPLAFAVYNQDEIGVGTIAGNFALFRNREHPERVFAPRSWMIVADFFSIRAGSESMILVYIMNVREAIEHYILVDLTANRFVPLFIPNSLYHRTFAQLDTDLYAMMPLGDQDVPPYRRSYRIETALLAWQPYHRRDDGFDDTTIAEPIRNRVWHKRPPDWHNISDRTYRLALTEETPNDAQIVSDRVLERIHADDILDPTQGAHLVVEADEQQLRSLIEEERASLRREREKQA